jgi:alanine-synthesizing transaminase
VQRYYHRRGVGGVRVDNVYLGNGVSELIVMSLQALLNPGDEVLVPSPDYPLWTGAVSLCGGRAVHYRCAEDQDWNPDVENVASLVTPKTRALVIINPNNPTGAVYSRETLEQLLEIARRHNLLVLADEIYDQIVYDGAVHHPNVPAQHAIPAALDGGIDITPLLQPGGRLRDQRDRAWDLLNEIPGVDCHKPAGALYLFPRLDPEVHKISDDEKMCIDFLEQQHVLLTHGSGFNLPTTDHVRVVFLAPATILEDAVSRLGAFLAGYKQ